MHKILRKKCVGICIISTGGPFLIPISSSALINFKGALLMVNFRFLQIILHYKLYRDFLFGEKNETLLYVNGRRRECMSEPI